MRERKLMNIGVVLATFIYISCGCEIVDHTWNGVIHTTILDVLEAGQTVISRSTIDIEDVIGVTYGPATLAGPYFDLSIENSLLVIRTNAQYPRYEEVEVAQRVTLTLNFSCTGGGTRGGLLIWIDITDTNNNAPEFLPSGEFEFVITPPLPPDFLVTGCSNEVITVRDIDLTTYRIDFTIQDNPYFEIEYDTAASAQVDKQFVAQLRTKTFIRSLDELQLTITATDVDTTTDEALTTTGVIRIVPNSEFQFPEELVFTQTFYLANYTDDHQLNLLETISLRQGFDEYVNFTLEGAYFENFELRPDGNEVSIVVIDPVPNELWSERQIFLVVHANREYTSGASATVIVQFPEEIELRFERVFYEGTITNNALQVEPLVLTQGYEDSVSAEVVGEYSTHFTATVQSDLVTLTMTPLMDDVIDNNSFISLQVVATSSSSSATTVVNLEIIKDDNNTPVFDKFVYNGTYDTATGLTMEQIYFVQGFDNTVAVNLTGEYARYFEIDEVGPVMTISSLGIPPEIFSLGNILITIEATKPRTVGANAAINVALPAARALEFEESAYRGSLEGGLLTLQTILLSQGYEEGVRFDLSGEHSIHFTAFHERDVVTIALQSTPPDTVIAENSVILLTLTASGPNAITTTTTILLDIIKEDTTTPVFTQHIYYGTYANGAVEIEPIVLSQGHDSTVSFRIEGAHAQYFNISENAVITLELPIPEDVIFSEKVSLFNVLADKALTVGANAAVLIRFPAELTESAIMRFSRHTYVGTLEENELNLEEIVLDTGFAPGTEFIISGDYRDHFNLTSTENVLQISALSTLPEVLEENDFIVLEVEARRERAVSVWTSVVVDIVKQEVIAPVFGQAYYTGAYTEETGLTFEETINLSEGYDETVTFALIGEPEAWFSIEQDGESLTLVSRDFVPPEVLENNNQLLFTIIANKPNATSGRAVISLDLPKDFSDSAFRFQQDFYKGYLENGNLVLNDIILGDYTSDVNYTYSGDYTEHFQLINQNGTFTLQIDTSIPNGILEEINVFVFGLEARNTIIRTHTIIIIENVRVNEVSQIIEFEEPYYLGSYSSTENLQIDSVIRVIPDTHQNVLFELEGEQSVWFELVPNGNSVTLTLTSPIPETVLANNQQLVFIVTAQSPGSTTARATIVIALTDLILEEPTILAFDRVTYLGSIENNQLNISEITLLEGYTPGVLFDLHGELQNYFSLSPEGAVVTVALRDEIPEELIPSNRIIVLEIQATAPQAITAYATIVIEYIVDNDISAPVELIFAQTFYRGSYAATTGLSFPTPISLTQGYESSVEFALEGDDAEWFSLVPNGNSVTVILSSPIPAGVIASNQQLVFVVTAQSPGSATARATVTITLLDAFPEGSVILGFDRVTYLGSIENNQLNISEITLREGYSPGVEFVLHGELQEYFSLSPDDNIVTVTLQGAIPEQLIPANRIIVLEIQATAPDAVTAYATILIEYIVDDDVSSVVELIFAQTFYRGSYAATTGLSFPTPISLTQGYESSVEFALEGDDAEWFSLVPNGNSVTVILSSPIPAGVIASNQQLVFVVTAQSPGSATARTTVTITLLDAFPEGSAILGFDRVTYLGSIENNQLNISEITLREGYTPGVEFVLHGELQYYFSLSPDENIVTVTLQGAIPEQLIPANRIIVLEIQATAPDAVTAYATIVIEYIVDDDVSSVVELIFAQTFYRGSYAATTGLSFPTPISLIQGYESSVEFSLEGDDAEWFSLVPNGNSVTVILSSPIPAGVIASNQQLVFVVTAQSPGSATARATVTITLLDAFPEGSVILGFDRVTYLGSIENNQLNISEITLREGYSPGVEFVLHGELQDYFSLSPDEKIVTVTLQGAIPEQLIPANRIIVLEIQATAPDAVTAYATIVIEYIVDDDVSSVVELIFAQTFYRGSYAATTGLSFPTPISLTQGYESSVEFALEGDDAEWFSLVPNGNSVTVILSSPIPAGVIASNQQLVFVVTAQSPGSATARTTVTITLLDAFPEGSVILGFDRVTYLGSIENNQLNISEITLREGYSPGVEFVLHGELQDYFSLSPDDNIVTVTLQGAIPEQLIPANRIIVLEIQATAPDAVTAYATIVIEYIVDDDVSSVVELIFAQTFYRGSYAATTGLSFPTPISLTQGYESSVEFALEGDDAEWFSLVPNGNSVTVILSSPIPAGVIASNQQLVFVVTAQSPGSATARTTVTITLLDAFPEGSVILGFDRVTYLGSIENNQLNISEITLREGYSPGVEFVLHGELQDYFSLSPDDNIVTVTLQGAIPEQLIPANRIIVLEIQATAPDAVTAYATIVIEYIVDDDVSSVVELIFAQTFYRGSYAATTGLSFPTPISLTQGYESSVEFALEGDDAEWFSLVPNGNSVTVILSSPIPAGVIASNQQLVFVVTAQSPGSATARTTVTITLLDAFPEGSAILGFDRVTYLGFIENNQLNISEITLREGYTPGVEFVLHGELQDYFSLSPDENIVTVILQGAIPEQLIPANRIILLEIQATAPDAVTAYATIVIEYIVDDDVSSVVELIFAQTFYRGSYAATTGLSFPTPISLTQGYESSVEFALEGDDAEWFSLVPNGNSVTVILSSPIPAGVIASNQQLVFVVTAQSPGSATARTTVTITLLDAFPEGSAILGFDRVTYLGSIENNQLNISEITLREGYSPGVEFVLHGELQDYFSLSPDDNIVTVTLQGAIPEQLIPANRIIVLEIQATAPDAVTAYATIVIEYIVDDDGSSVVELIFAQTFYRGSYAATTGLSFPTPISLTQGYESSVEFALEGDDAEWFSLVPNGNSVTVILSSPIPAGVIASNQQLVFVVTAQSPGSATARTTVTITLLDAFPEGSAILGFDRVTYLGSIENNQLNISEITLREGYTPGVEFVLHGELQDYFSLSPDENIVTVTLQGAIPEQLIPANRIIVLEIQATAPDAVTAYATIVIEYIVDDDVSSVVELIFAQTFYRGSYAATTGLSFPTPISLTQGYESSVEFALEGDDAEWFGLVPNGNSVTVILSSPIPAGVIASNQQLVFVVTAQSPGSATARTTVTITLLDAFPEGSVILGFDRVTYLGSIENNQLNISEITLREGYSPGVEFVLHGELQDYFSLSPDDNIVAVTLQGAIPEQLIPANRIIVLEIQATAPDAVTAYATIVIEYIVDDDVSSVVELIFAQTFYRGSYAATTGLLFPTPISLTQGYESSVEFALEGDDAEWFSLVPNGNSVTVILSSPIPTGVIASNQQLVFVVTAQSPGSATARTTVTITLLDAFPEGSAILGFDRVTYLGSIENNQLNISEITLREGYTPGVEFVLHGELQDYFSLSPDENIVTVTLQGAIPEQLIPANRIIVLEIQATAPDAVTAYATIVIEYIVDDDVSSIVELIFAQTFYRGSYAATTGLLFPTPMSLTQGYESSVEFALEGDDAEWFSLVPNGNSVTVILSSPIPAGVIASNQQLVFVVTAQSPGSATARTTVTITLLDAFPEGSAILGFDRVTYLGSIENNQLNISEITLREGYTPGVEFVLHGELQDYFSLSPDENIVTVTLQGAFPEQLIPANRIIVLEIQATAPDAVTAYATIVIEYIVDDDVSSIVELIFAQTFYRGSYAATTGLLFPTPISLTQGYESSVEFALEGDDAEWFSLVPNGNSVTVILSSPIPAGVIASNQQLVFVVTAQSPGSATARTTVTITLLDAFPEGSAILGFDRVTYLGSIENNQLNISEITLREGYTPGVEFVLHGELQDYFSLSPDENIVTVTLQGAIPEQLIPANRIIVLEIQATAPDAVTAYATIVIEYIVDDDVSSIVELIFAQTFYRGSYAATTGLLFPTPISLTQGYESSVEFALEGDDAEWFSLVPNGNSVTVILSSPIPVGVIASNQQLVFVVTAQSPGSATARTTVTITLLDAFPEGSVILGFDRVTYLGSIENNQLNISEITLREGYSPGVEFVLHGELQDYFSLSPDDNIVTVTLQGAIPEQLIPANRIIVLEIQATAPDAVTAYATIVIEYIVDDDVSSVVELIFAQTFYRGSYAATTGLSFPTPISLTQGYESSVEFALEGDDAEWFSLVPNGNSVTVILSSPIPAGVIASNQQLVFVVTAQSPGSATARTTVTITLLDAFPEGSAILGFDRVTYLGSIENNQLNISEITLREGYSPGVEFVLHGELQDYFSLSPDDNIVTVTLQGAIPEQLIPANRIIVLEIQATAPDAVTAYATIVIEYIVDDDVSSVVELIFAQTFYRGSYAATTGLSFPTPISLTQGYESSVEFALEGDDAEWFSLVPNGNSVTVILSSPIPAGVIASNQQLVFVVTAQSPGSATARTTVTITLLDAFPEGSAILGFDRVTYLGSIENNQLNISEIILREGYTPGVEFVLHGELQNYFSLSPDENIVTVTLQGEIPEQSIPANRIIVLEIQATAPDTVTAYATIVIEYIVDDDINPIVEIIFSQTFYRGSYAVATGLSFPTAISLTQGYDSNVEFNLEGDYAQWFSLMPNGNSVTVILISPIPAEVIANNQQLVFAVTAQSPGSATARAIVIISLDDDTQPGSDVTFDKVLYEGFVQNSVVNHETITVIGFSGSTIELHGEYSSSFVAVLSNGIVTVSASSSFTIPSEVSHVALELRAGSASAVLVLNVVHADVPTTPTVTFSSSSYAIRVDITQTGLVGQVQATADNGEDVSYSLQLNNAHLQERLRINDDGELHLSAPVDSNFYTFEVVATTRFTQIQGNAVVHLSVEAVTVCGDDLVMPPLIILDVDEEEPHNDLINGTRYDGCHFTLTSRWPLDQTWVYVDEGGLHTTAIDREHESIAFMAVSQVQVEVILHCEADSTRIKRSVASDALGPYDYGSNKWVLTDTILFNSRRSLVNIIVNDINDNAPIFVDKANEPIAVGYPVPELAERVLPRSLAELQATDADIGENAALQYWSSAPQLAVAPTTGFVHLRDGATLENGARLTVSATDRNGEGLTGSIDILVRLLDESYIAVVTVRDAFLDDEEAVLSSLSEAVGYEIKVLRSVVISDEVEEVSRKDVTSASGASLQLYVYGLIAREPVSVEQLTEDINNIVTAAVTVASSVSLEDHLEGQEICVIAGRDTGLLVATIVLSVLLFIVLVLIAVWFFLRWRKNRNYDQFSDKNSLASRNASEDTLPKPEALPKPRLDIAELKRSERRLQEMLDAPIEEISIEPTSSRNDAIVNMPVQNSPSFRSDPFPKMPEPLTPIVIQSIDKLKDAADESTDDEFGEVKTPRRKSVVTFNENVEKIIHVEEPSTPDTEDGEPDYEVYKL